MAQQLDNNDNVAHIEQVRVVGLELPDASVQTTTTFGVLLVSVSERLA